MDLPGLIQIEKTIALFDHDTLAIRLKKSEQSLRQWAKAKLPNRWNCLSARMMVETATRQKN